MGHCPSHSIVSRLGTLYQCSTAVLKSAKTGAKKRVAPGPIRVSAGDDRANPGLLEQASAHARGKEVLPARGGSGKIARLGVQHTDVVASLPSHDLRTG